MTNRLDKMDYVEFTQHLKDRGIDYILKEETDIEVWFTVLTVVTPLSSRLKIVSD